MEKSLPLGTRILTLNDAISPYQLAPKIEHLQSVKRGDYCRIVLQFPETPAGSKNDHEFLTLVVREVTPGGLLKSKVASVPQFAITHGLSFSDEITISSAYVLEHYSTPADQVKQTERSLSTLPTLPPANGKEYWTRNGSTATIWTDMQENGTPFKIGEVSWPGGQGMRDVRWFLDGRCHTKPGDFDIVKDPAQSDATLYEEVEK